VLLAAHVGVQAGRRDDGAAGRADLDPILPQGPGQVFTLSGRKDEFALAPPDQARVKAAGKYVSQNRRKSFSQAARRSMLATSGSGAMSRPAAERRRFRAADEARRAS